MGEDVKGRERWGRMLRGGTHNEGHLNMERSYGTWGVVSEGNIGGVGDRIEELGKHGEELREHLQCGW